MDGVVCDDVCKFVGDGVGYVLQVQQMLVFIVFLQGDFQQFVVGVCIGLDNWNDVFGGFDDDIVGVLIGQGEFVICFDNFFDQQYCCCIWEGGGDYFYIQCVICFVMVIFWKQVI